MMIEVTNGIRAWGFTALLFAVPMLFAFFAFAWRRAVSACDGFQGTHMECLGRFAAGAWQAGIEAELRVNTWVAVATLLFAGLAGGAIFVSSNFLGGYSTAFLNTVMLVFWSIITAAAWSVVVASRPTRASRRSMAASSGMMLVVMIYAATMLEAQT